MFLARVVKALVWFAASFFVCGDRDVHKNGKLGVSMTRDGHFQLAADAEFTAPAVEKLKEQRPVPGTAKRQIRALLPKTETVVSLVPENKKLQVLKPKVLKNEGGWYPGQPDSGVWRPAASSFVNRTEDWMTISQVAAGSLASSRLQTKEKEWFLRQPEAGDGKPEPQVPPERYKSKPKSWPGTSWAEYQRAYRQLAPMRSGAGNVVVTGAALILGPDCCLLKILYVFFAMEGEDDYPYIPRGCGDFFDFAMNANNIPVPWLLIGSALAIVTGTHSTANSL